MALLYQAVVSLLLIQLVVSHPTETVQKLSPEDAQRLASWKEGDSPMWQLSGQFEGDIVLTPEQRNGVVNTDLRWPNRQIPYEFSNDFTQDERIFINNALTVEYARTCVTVRPRTSADRDYVLITGQDTGCYSSVGRLGGQQILNLQRNGCIYHRTIVHEFFHAAGFYHQQSATERDDWVTIQWGNILDGKENNFDKYPSSMVTSFGQQYDYASIMHYDNYAFSKNGYPTIVTRDPVVIGKAERLSQTDIVKINMMYNC